MRRLLPPVGTLAVAFLASAPASGQGWLGHFEPAAGDNYSEVVAASATGLVAVGRSGDRGAIWESTGQPTTVYMAPSALSTNFRGVSEGGGVVVGVAFSSSGSRAIGWTPVGGGFELAPLAPGQNAEAWGVNSNGRYVVGNSSDANHSRAAVLWDRGSQTVQLIPVDSAAAGTTHFATTVSSDGSMVYGFVIDAGGMERAFRWERGAAFVTLLPVGPVSCGTGPSGGCQSVSATSANGEFAVGSTSVGFGPRATMWSSATGYIDLGILPGFQWSTARDVSADGRVVVGWSYNPVSVGERRSAFVWTPTTGMRDLASFAASQGSPFVPPTDEVRAALAVSDDGVVIFGSGFECTQPNCNDSAWRLQTGGFGDRFCGEATPNSTGLTSTLVAAGSQLVADNNLRLIANLLPANVPGMFICSVTAAPLPASLGGGTLCLGGAIGRIGDNGQLLISRPDGRMIANVNLTAMPSPGGNVSVIPGDTWYFQAWHYDPDPAFPRTNLSSAISVQFQ